MTLVQTCRPNGARPGSPPLLVAGSAAGGTGLILFPRPDSLPAAWVGPVLAGLEPDDVAALLAATIGGGELLLPGEVTLAEGESYTTPWVYLAASRSGLDELSAQFHGYLRSRPAHPRSPRPVNLNVWEAVYFRHDLDKLTAIADAAAGLGVERFVLDDGWFAGRRSDQVGLGDWWVDEEVWPGGLHRLVDAVRGHGMDLGHDRCPRPAADPALDRAADTAGVPGRARLGVVLAPDRPVHADVAARGHGAIRSHGHRSGHHRGR